MGAHAPKFTRTFMSRACLGRYYFAGCLERIRLQVVAALPPVEAT